MPSNLITVRACSLEDKERYNIVVVKYIYVLQRVRGDLLPCHLIQYMFVFPTTYLKLFLFHRLQGQNLFMAFKRVPPVVVTMGQQHNIGKKPPLIMYTYIINRHAGTQNKSKTKEEG